MNLLWTFEINLAVLTETKLDFEVATCGETWRVQSKSQKGAGGVMIYGARGWRLMSILKVSKNWVMVMVKKKDFMLEIIGVYFPSDGINEKRNCAEKLLMWIREERHANHVVLAGDLNRLWEMGQWSEMMGSLRLVDINS